MNLQTGEIKSFDGTNLPLGWIEIKKPKRNCKKCYGRGLIGRNVQTNEVIPCSCVKIKRAGEQG